MNAAPAIEINDLVVKLHGRTVLDRFSMKIASGEFAAVAGENGAGKTTLLRAILGLTQPHSGFLRVLDQTACRSTWRQLRRRIGYVPQVLSFDLNMPMSVRDVIAIGRCGRVGLGQRLGRADHEAVERSAAESGVERLLDRPVGRLSGGERQKMQIARALCQEPELLLLDEPTSQLDMAARIGCLELIERLHSTHKFPVVMVTHDLPSIPACCKRAILIGNGKKVFDGTVAGMMDAQILRPVFGDHAESIMRAARNSPVKEPADD